MAIDYFITLHQYGSDTNEVRLREFLMHEFPLVYHANTGILTGDGISVNVYIDDDDDNVDTNASLPPNLVISFRISKHKLNTGHGYLGMRHIVEKVTHSFDVNLHVSDEFDQYIYLTKKTGKVVTNYHDHDFWTMGASDKS